MTDLSKSQLATILSALDGERRSPANKDAAQKVVGRSRSASASPPRRCSPLPLDCSTAGSTPRRGGRS